MKNQGLVLYSKFDHETGFNYISPNNTERMFVDSYTELVDSFDGPFLIPNSSYRTNYRSDSLGFFNLCPKIVLPSFTLSFYLRVTGNEFVGIFYDFHDPGLRFTLTAANLDLELHTHDSSASHPSYIQTISSFTFRNVFKSNEWQFVALTYDGASKRLKLYDETANVKQEHANVQIDQVFTQQIGIGESLRFGDVQEFTQSSAIACLSVHNQVLSQSDVALLPCSCQFKDRQQ